MAGGCGGVAAMALPPAHSDCAAMIHKHACDDRGDNQNCNRVFVPNSRIVQVRGSKSTWVVLANMPGFSSELTLQAQTSSLQLRPSSPAAFGLLRRLPV